MQAHVFDSRGYHQFFHPRSDAIRAVATAFRPGRNEIVLLVVGSVESSIPILLDAVIPQLSRTGVFCGGISLVLLGDLEKAMAEFDVCVKEFGRILKAIDSGPDHPGIDLALRLAGDRKRRAFQILQRAVERHNAFTLDRTIPEDLQTRAEMEKSPPKRSGRGLANLR